MANRRMCMVTTMMVCLCLLVGCTSVSTSTTTTMVTTTTTVPSQATKAGDTVLSEQELERYENLLSFSEESFNWNSQAVCVPYDSPVNLDLGLFFWNGVGTQELTAEEQAFISQSGVNENYDIARIDVKEADAVLQQCFGIAWEQTNGVGLDLLLYNETENCYYKAANGAHLLGSLTIRSGIRAQDGTISLCWTEYDSNEGVVTFYEQDGALRFLSNVPPTP